MKSIRNLLFCLLLLIAVSLSSCDDTNINSYKHGKVILPWTVTVGATESMVPALNPGDIVTIYEFPYDDLESGMIVAKFSPSSEKDLVSHRIVGKLRDGTFVTRGDNNEINDRDFLTRENYVGLVKKGGGKPEIGVIILNKNHGK